MTYCSVCECPYHGQHICPGEPPHVYREREMHAELVRVLRLSCTTPEALGPDFENMARAVEAWMAEWV